MGFGASLPEYAGLEKCKELVGEDKQMITLDDNHVYMIAKYGPVIKKTVGENQERNAVSSF